MPALSRGIGILGAAGRVGRLLAQEAVRSGLPIAGGVDRPGATLPPGVTMFETVERLAASCDVLIDFTHASATAAHLDAAAGAGQAYVLGTTGLDAAAQDAISRASQRIALVRAANFSPGVVLAQALARRMGAALPAADYDVEILEMHHRQKVDAPSGTALALGEAVAAGRGASLAPLRLPAREGDTGPRPDGGIGFAALRGGQIVGEHSVIFAAAHEQIILTHRAFDRATFAAGALRAAMWVVGQKPGLYGMEQVLGM